MSQLQHRMRGAVWVLLAGLAGCHSRTVEVIIVNQGPPLHVMEFDYPSAGFGANLLATGASYRYSIKVQGPGPVSLQYEDAAGHVHKGTGPNLNLGDEGALSVKVDARGAVTWTSNVTHAR